MRPPLSPADKNCRATVCWVIFLRQQTVYTVSFDSAVIKNLASTAARQQPDLNFDDLVSQDLTAIW